MAQAVDHEQDEHSRCDTENVIVRRERMISETESVRTTTGDRSMSGGIGWSPKSSTIKFNMLDIPWFHPNLTRHQAEAELKNSEEGVYLLRPRLEQGRLVEGYSLDIRSTHSVKHFRIDVHRGNMIFGQETFSDLESFLQHFKNYPLIGDDTGHLIVFKHPYPRDIDEIDDYSHVLEHFIPETRASTEIDTSPGAKTYSHVSKEGYLVKLGNVVKTWKTRWFVLDNEELRYYAKERDKNPIRVINLREATDVRACGLHPIHRKENAFRLVLPWRTFFLQAPSSVVRDEWIHVLDFKLRELSEAKKHTIPPVENRIVPGPTSRTFNT